MGKGIFGGLFDFNRDGMWVLICILILPFAILAELIK